MIYVYAVIAGPRSRPALPPGSPVPPPGSPVLPPGLEESPTEVIAVGEIAAICSSHEGFTPETRLEALQRHHAVVEAAMRTGAVLPARFGTSFDDVNALRDVLSVRHDELAHLLMTLAGKAELALRARLSREAAAGEGDHDRELYQLCGALECLSVASVVNRRAPGALTAAFLVAQEDVVTFRDSTAEVVSRHPAVRATLTGPWPPYSFATADTLTDETSLARSVAGWSRD